MSFNSEQKLAIEYNKLGALAVIAGAGTGKTTVLTNRILYLINQLGYNPANILVITFTNKVGNELKERLAKLGQTNLSWVGTFHSVCYRILRQHINCIGRETNFRIIDQDEVSDLISSVIDDDNIYSQLTKKNITYYIELIKRTYPCFGYEEEYANKLALDNLHKFPLLNRELAIFKKVWFEYEEKLKRNNYLDFNDLLNYSNYLLENHSNIQEYWQNKFDYILVDEFQDTNHIQYNFLKLILNPNKNIFVVGDTDQTIYGFRGSNPNIVNEFIDDFNADKIILHTNYRSTQSILNVANDLINKNTNRIKKDLMAFDDQIGNKPILHEAIDDKTEAAYVIKEIKKLIANNVSLKNICILVRSNYLTREFEHQLFINDINYKVYGGVKFYQRKEIKDILAYLNLAVSNDDLLVLRTINVPSRKIGDTTINIIKNINPNELIYNNLLQYNSISNLSNVAKNGIANYLSLINKIREFKYHSIVELVEFIIKETDYYEYVKNKDIEKFYSVKENLIALKQGIVQFEAGSEDKSIQNYLNSLALLLDKENTNNSDALSIMTIHSAKGLEFDYVFLVCFNQNIFPSYLSLNDGEKAIQEERRVAYVAMTRAKKQLWITYNLGYDYASNSLKKPSVFISNISNSLFEKKAPISSFHTKNHHFEHIPKIEDITKYYNKTISISDFNIGDTIEHKTYGIGYITDIIGEKLNIKFKKPYGEKTIVYNHISITKVFD